MSLDVRSAVSTFYVVSTIFVTGSAKTPDLLNDVTKCCTYVRMRVSNKQIYSVL